MNIKEKKNFQLVYTINQVKLHEAEENLQEIKDLLIDNVNVIYRCSIKQPFNSTL